LEKTALLVFSALAYVSAKNQMCCLCGWIFLNETQRHAMFSATALFDSPKLIIFAELTSPVANFKSDQP
jgi:hypothetical protein